MWLVVMLNTHCQHIQEDENENGYLESARNIQTKENINFMTKENATVIYIPS